MLSQNSLSVPTIVSINENNSIRHDCIFAPYGAGKERTVQTIKGITRFEWPEKIQSNAQVLFGDLKNEHYLQNLVRSQFIERAAHYFGELNVIHPFPEGNGRAQRALFDGIARQAGYEFNWSKTTKDKLIEAVVHAYVVDASKLEAVFDQTLFNRELAIEHDVGSSDDIFSIANPIGKTDYDKAVTLINSKRVEIEKELYPTSLPDPMEAEKRKRTVSRVLKERYPESIDIKEAYEANLEISDLFNKWRSLDHDINSAKELNDDKTGHELMSQKGRLLATLKFKNSVVKQLSSNQKRKIENDYKFVEQALLKMRSHEHGRGR